MLDIRYQQNFSIIICNQMTEKLNKIYVDGLTRFQTQNKSSSHLTCLEKDPTLERYSKRSYEKRVDLEKFKAIETKTNSGEGLDKELNTDLQYKIERLNNNKDMSSKSADKFLGAHQYPMVNKSKEADNYLRREFRQRINTSYYPSPELNKPRGNETPYFEKSKNIQNKDSKNKLSLTNQDICSKYTLNQNYYPLYRQNEYLNTYKKQDYLQETESNYKLKQKIENFGDAHRQTRNSMYHPTKYDRQKFKQYRVEPNKYYDQNQHGVNKLLRKQLFDYEYNINNEHRKQSFSALNQTLSKDLLKKRVIEQTSIPKNLTTRQCINDFTKLQKYSNNRIKTSESYPLKADKIDANKHTQDVISYERYSKIPNAKMRLHEQYYDKQTSKSARNKISYFECRNSFRERI